MVDGYLITKFKKMVKKMVTKKKNHLVRPVNVHLIKKKTMKTIKIFVSVPMKGRAEQEVREQIQRLYKKSTEGCSGDHTATETLINFELIDTFITETPPEGLVPKYWYRQKSAEMLLQADVVIMGSGYDEAVGCMMELQLAQFLGKKITFE